MMARTFDGCRLLATADAEAARERDAVRQTLRTYVFIGADMEPSVRDPNDTLRGTVSGLAAAVESWLQVESMDAVTEANWRALLRRLQQCKKGDGAAKATLLHFAVVARCML
jgi:hypothetical protein